MRDLTLVILLAVGLHVATPADAIADTVRDALAAATLHTLDGEPVAFDDLDGRTVVLNFWAAWCAPCRRELPILDGWTSEFAARNVVFAAVSIDREPRKARQLADQLGLELPLYHDGPDELAATLDLPALPITYVVDPSGRTVFTSNGSDDDALAALRSAIVAAAPAASTHEARGADR